VPVFRFDRRGIGDSTGENRGFRNAGQDIAAAAATFRAETGVARLVSFGNCDAATALALFGQAAGIDAIVLANPWIVEPSDDLPPTAAIREHYAARLRDPREVWRLVRGGVNIAKLTRGLARLAQGGTAPSPLAEAFAQALQTWRGRATILLASGDATSIAYKDAMARMEMTLPTFARDTDSHSFARAGDAEWLEERIVEGLRLLA
jgi:pimeloyl-ACP methyl ester carboxylesterase